MNLNFEYDVDCRPRYWPAPHQKLNEIISAECNRYQEHLRKFAGCAEEFAAIGRQSQADGDPFWENGFFGGTDAIALHGILAEVQPSTYFEIGSGNSTRFARHAVRIHGLRTRIVSLDREPRAQIDSLCDEVIRSPLEQTDMSVFDRLNPGDILFYDGSHQVLQNSDVTVFFLDVLPRLRPGVWVHIHDVYLPWDYPPDWVERHYAEQYMLACWLLSETPRLQLELANYFISRDASLMAHLDPIYQLLPGLQAIGGSFWMRIL
jgi:methyltransferase family protein